GPDHRRALPRRGHPRARHARRHGQRPPHRRGGPGMSDTLLVEPSAVSPAKRATGVLLRSREISVAAVLVLVIVLTTLKNPNFLFSSDGWRDLLLTPSLLL